MKWRFSMVRDVVALVWAMVAMILPAAAQQVTVERDSELRAEARYDAKVVAALKQGVKGEITAKNGVWLNIKTPEATGWLFSFNVRFASSQQTSESSSTSSLGRLFGPRQRINVTSTIGVRGLGEEDLRQAHFDDTQMRLLDQYAASRADAESRAQATGLSSAQVEYLDAGSP